MCVCISAGALVITLHLQVLLVNSMGASSLFKQHVGQLASVTASASVSATASLSASVSVSAPAAADVSVRTYHPDQVLSHRQAYLAAMLARRHTHAVTDS